MSAFWNWYISGIVVFTIVFMVWLLHWTRKTDPDEPGPGETTGHVYDGIEEYNNPMPAWWLQLFYATIVFGVIYLALYPGLGSYEGILGWTSKGQWEAEIKYAENNYQPLFEQYALVPIEELVNSPEALAVGQRLFANNCSVCHGSDARGSKGYPNLTDNDWLYGGSPETIVQSIVQGRRGAMPAFSGSLNEEQIDQLAHYVASLGRPDIATKAPAKVAAGGDHFKTLCTACHGVDAKGNQALGAPNLSDKTWLYGGSLKNITETLEKGRNGNMPAHDNLISPEKIHVIATYVYSLSQGEEQTASTNP